MVLRVFLLATLAALCSQGADNPGVRIAARPARPKPDTVPANLRVDVKLVLIPVTVTDLFGAPFKGLTQTAFRLLENGIEQKIKYFSAEEAPVSLGLIFDASRSMEGKLDESRAAVSHVFHTALPKDEYFVVEFSDAPRLLCPFTNDTKRIEKSLTGIAPRNWTALLDAIYLGIQQMQRARNSRKALLILSDGGDNSSRYTESEMRSLVREADVCIYSIALVGGGLMRRHVPLLKHLAAETGGRVYEVEKMTELPEAVEKLSEAIRHQYLLGYSSNDGRNTGLYRKVEVRLEQPARTPRLRASWRTGYYTP
ncbi:MAG: VWA domain-containing protein [Bryobacteraceae bacterium]